MRLDLVTVVVDDYDLAIRFFADGFGFELVEDEPALTSDGRPKRWVVVRPPGGGTGLLLARADGEDQARAVGRQAGDRVGFFLQVADVDVALERVLRAGGAVVRPARDEPYGRVAVVRDVVGNRWDLLGPVDNPGGPVHDRPTVESMSAGPADPPLITAEQLFELPDDGLRHELVEGVLVSMPPASFAHGDACLEIATSLGSFLRAHPDLGRAVANDTGFLLRRGPDTVMAPDVAFVSSARLPRDLSRFAELAPDLVVEVVSPSDRASDVTAKALAWVTAGVRLVWVVDPQARIATVYRTDNRFEIVREDGVLDGEDVVPGFRLPLAEVLAQ